MSGGGLEGIQSGFAAGECQQRAFGLVGFDGETRRLQRNTSPSVSGMNMASTTVTNKKPLMMVVVRLNEDP